MKKYLFMLMIVVLFLSGCDDESPPPPSALYIYGGTDHVSKGWFAYADVFENVVRKRGLSMNYETGDAWYLRPISGGHDSEGVSCPDEQHVECNGATGGDGYCHTNGERDQKEVEFYWVYSGLAFYAPNHTDGAHVAGFEFDSQHTPGTPLVRAASAQSDGTLSPPADSPESSRFTTAERTAIDEPTTDAPESSADISPAVFVDQMGDCGAGWCKEATCFIPINLTTAEQYLKYAGPYRVSWTIKTASPRIAGGRVGSAKLTSIACPDGITVDVELLGSNADKQTHVVTTEWFLPIDSAYEISNQETIDVYDCFTPCPYDPNQLDTRQYAIELKSDWLSYIDPNLYSDPNVIPDPNVLCEPVYARPDLYNFYNRLDTSLKNFEDILIPERIMSLKVIPVNRTEDPLKVRLNLDPLLALDYWLTDDPTGDLNQDGIVNLKDWALALIL